MLIHDIPILVYRIFVVCYNTISVFFVGVKRNEGFNFKDVNS